MTEKYCGDWLRPCRQWLPRPKYPAEWAVVAATVPSTVADLRVGETAGIKVRGWNLGYCHLLGRKGQP